MKSKRHVPGLDVQDVEQSLYLRLSSSLRDYDPQRGRIDAFVQVVLDRHGSNLNRRDRAVKRGKIGDISLQVQIHVDGRCVELAQQISDHELSKRTGVYHRDDQEARDLAADVAEIISKFPSEDQRILAALKQDCVAHAAERLRMPATTLRHRVRKYRQIFEDAGLGHYLR